MEIEKIIMEEDAVNWLQIIISMLKNEINLNKNICDKLNIFDILLIISKIN